MSSLDEDSYCVTEPLHLPPTIVKEEEKVFQSCEYPKVLMDKQEEEEEDGAVMIVEKEEEKKDDDGESNKRNKKGIKKDQTINDSTREELTISPFTVRGLMKVLESCGNDCSNWPEIEKTLLPVLQFDLMLHQKHAICWMAQMESLGGFGINSILWEEREFLDEGGGKYYYSPALGQIRLESPPVMKGGILADEMGLGKTVEVLGLVVATLEELKAEAKSASSPSSSSSPKTTTTMAADSHELYWHATLIIVPPTLLRQWIREIKKATGSALEVHSFDAVALKFVTEIARGSGVSNDVNGRDSPDIVVATYGALEKPRSSKVLASICWGRIVLDEMQEIRSSTTAIAMNCEKLSCSRRWMLSGTPLFEGIDDLRGELNFLRLEPYAAALEDGFFDFSITNHWKARSEHGLETLRILGLLLLRRAKNMTLRLTGQPILGLKGLTVEFVPIAQSPSERALYCWMEYIVSEDLTHGTDLDDSIKSRNMCLRLLRLLCISPVLVNGGLGALSQLKFIHRVMIRANRRQQLQEEASWSANTYRGLHDDHLERTERAQRHHQIRVLSCDGALRFLTQVQSAANVHSDFITDVTFGVGGGVANRNRATDSAEDMLKEVTNEMEKASENRSAAKKERATMRWHIALEKVTTGFLLHEYSSRGVDTKFSNLWKWRYIMTSLMENRTIPQRQTIPALFSRLMGNRTIPQRQKLPVLLSRGWRPSPSFINQELYSLHPEFFWAHPSSLQLDRIPEQLTIAEVTASMHEACKQEPKALRARALILARLGNEGRESQKEILKKELIAADNDVCRARDNDKKVDICVIKRPCRLGSTDWKAFFQFARNEDMQCVIRRGESVNGIPLKSAIAVPQVQERINAAEARLEEAESENKVYPCLMHQMKVAEAKKEVRRARLGLKIVFDERNGNDINHENSVLSRSMGPHRSLLPKTMRALVDSAKHAIPVLTGEIYETSTVVETCKRKVKRLKSSLGISGEVRELSAFETLDALGRNELEKTKCPICLGSFGAALEETSEIPIGKLYQPVAAMISCGHLFCIDCLDHHTNRQMAASGRVACPNCRKTFSPVTDVVHVDHTRKDDEQRNSQREDARLKVREASKMLEESNGQLDGGMWHALFLSFDVPDGVNTRGHANFPAIPREVLAHVRKATGMDIQCSRNDRPAGKRIGFSSKVLALLHDLDLNERSVVFAASKESVRHLLVVFEIEGIGCQALFTGQNPSKSEQAVSEWEKDIKTHGKHIPSCPVLIVQSGAAASGLTLTAASKIFLMEPFLRQEEEHQAYARCHRFGQKREVHVKCYYSPVTVESRLLEWRKQGQAMPSSTSLPKEGATNFIFSKISQESSDDEEEVSEVDPSEYSEDAKRTRFLLNLSNE